MPLRDERIGRAVRVHPHAWLWEPLEADASFILGSMFGTKVAYLSGKLVFCFATKEEPWRGMLVGTEREHHASLVAEFPLLSPHPVLGKWLYLRESEDGFERAAERLVLLAQQRDPRLGVVPKAKKRRRA